MNSESGKLEVTTPSDREVLITRSFDAPCQLVWDAWTKPELLKKWLHGWDGWRLEVRENELRPGGAIRWVWRGPNGEEMGLRGVYREIVPPERLVHTEIFDEDWTGGETLVTLVLTERGGRTTTAMTVLYSSREARDAALKTGMTEGMEVGYERLGKLLVSMEGDLATPAPAMLKVTTPNDHQIVMTRAFDAPRRLVWDAMTKAELVRRWMFCPPGWSWAECEMDVRAAGKFRWAWNGPDGKLALSISGEHREVMPPTKIVHTERMELGPGSGVCGPESEGAEPDTVLVTLELDEQGGQTHMKMTISCPTREIRDAMLASGMERGMEAGYQNLDAILAEQHRR